MKTYKSYQKLNEPYFSLSELLGFPIIPLGVVALVSYVVLSLFGLTTMLVVDVVIAFFANAYYHGLKNATPNGSSNSGGIGMPGILVILSLLPSFLVILAAILISTTGFYIVYLYQETGVFHGIYFGMWLFVIVGIPIIYAVSIQLKYTNELYDQARKFTPLSLDIVQDVDYLTCGLRIEFLHTQKELIAKIDLSHGDKDDHEQYTTMVSGRNKKLYQPVFSDTVRIPKDANRLKLSWYSIAEDIYYADEIDFPFQLLDYVECKYPTDISKVLRGERTDRVLLFIQPGGKVLLLNKHKIIIDSTVLNTTPLDKKRKSEWMDAASHRYGVNGLKNLIAKSMHSKSIAEREALRDYQCDWKVTGKGLDGHNVEIKDVVLNYATSDSIVLDTFEKRRLPILFDIDYHKLSWLFIHIDAEKLYALIQLSDVADICITFDLAVDLANGEAALNVKNNDVVLPFTAWEKVIDPYRWKEATDYLNSNKEAEDKNEFLKRIYELTIEKEYSKAKEVCMEALLKYPFFPMVYFYEARLLFYTQGYEASYAKESYFITKTQQEPYALAQIYNHYGCLYDEEKRYPESLASFEKAYTNYPDQLFYLANIAEIYYKLKDAKKALHSANECVSKGCSLDILTEIIKNKGVLA